MAITDILERISSDAAVEALDIVRAAEDEAARITAEADATLARERAALFEATERDAANDAATLLANARLAARDAVLAEKRALAEDVLRRAREALEALPDAAYLELIAAGVAAASSGGETLLVAPADAKRLAKLTTRLRELGCDIAGEAGQAPDLPERGVLLVGDRQRVEISPASLINDRREELLLVAARALFGEGE